jgi:hypothetical protein
MARPWSFAIFGQKIDFCFNGLKCSFGSPLTPEQKNKFEEKNHFRVEIG